MRLFILSFILVAWTKQDAIADAGITQPLYGPNHEAYRYILDSNTTLGITNVDRYIRDHRFENEDMFISSRAGTAFISRKVYRTDYLGLWAGFSFYNRDYQVRSEFAFGDLKTLSTWRLRDREYKIPLVASLQLGHWLYALNFDYSSIKRLQWGQSFEHETKLSLTELRQSLYFLLSDFIGELGYRPEKNITKGNLAVKRSSAIHTSFSAPFFLGRVSWRSEHQFASLISQDERDVTSHQLSWETLFLTGYVGIGGGWQPSYYKSPDLASPSNIERVHFFVHWRGDFEKHGIFAMNLGYSYSRKSFSSREISLDSLLLSIAFLSPKQGSETNKTDTQNNGLTRLIF